MCSYYKNVRKEWASLVSTPTYAKFQDALAFTRSLGDLHLHTYGTNDCPCCFPSLGINCFSEFTEKCCCFVQNRNSRDNRCCCMEGVTHLPEVQMVDLAPIFASLQQHFEVISSLGGQMDIGSSPVTAASCGTLCLVLASGDLTFPLSFAQGV